MPGAGSWRQLPAHALRLGAALSVGPREIFIEGARRLGRATELRKAGESELRIYMLNAWRESPLYTARERAALAWTEALTLLSETGAPDADYDLLKAEFSEPEQVSLTLAIGAINAWNRLQVGFRASHPVEAGRAAA